LSDSFTFSVQGDPIPQGSMTAGVTKDGRRFMRPDNPKLRPWRNRITKMARILWAREDASAFGPLDCAVDVEVWCYIQRPKSHYGSLGRLLDSAPDFPDHAKGTDVDKLARAVLDSLTVAVVYADDVRVVDLHAYKRYADRTKPGVHVTVRPHRNVVVMAEAVALQEALL
jgi:Holliday junction resolvase RusA-like endonuclease